MMVKEKNNETTMIITEGWMNDREEWDGGEYEREPGDERAE